MGRLATSPALCIYLSASRRDRNGQPDAARAGQGAWRGGSILVSVITACYNAAGTIEEAIGSLRSQTHREIEHIVIDGGSRDGTVEIIKRHADGLAYWSSEPDKGLADAWNKGLAKARGGIIGLLNADDLYRPDTVENACRSLQEGELALTYGDAEIFSEDSSKPDSIFRGDFRRDFLFNGFGFMHTTCFATRRVYEEVGGFDTSYRIGVDTDFLLRCIRHGVEFRKTGSITRMRSGGMSERRHAQAYGEFLSQLWRYGYSKPRIAMAWLHYQRRRLFDGIHPQGGR